MLVAAFLEGCQSQKSNSILLEAHEYHQEAIVIREKLGQRLIQAESKEDYLTVSRMEEIKNALQEWDEALVEVPGFEHEHGHEEEGHDHRHHHNPVPNLSSQEHLELQKHFLESIKMLEKSFADPELGQRN